MKCPFCGYEEDKVVESRSISEETVIRRRRECLKCRKRFTSYERVEERPLMVVKKDGSRQVFNREKVMGGILRAVEKRPVSAKSVDEAMDEIEKALYEGLPREVTTKQIGELVMDKLQNLDKVAYIRFASVYREFKDVNEFIREIKGLSR